MQATWIIEKKRDDHELSHDEIQFLIEGYLAGSVPEYQMSAWLMAVYFRGLSATETSSLTEIMMSSGTLLDTSSVSRPKVDKHSTGGVGDKVSLILAPALAACDVVVPMISGRGLGFTGGTLDKLESISGFRTDLSENEFMRVLSECGCVISGQTSELVPADRRIYALRDVTATVPSIPLIIASIMSKKLAEGIDGLVLDVKCGAGAFMKSLEDARHLAKGLVTVGQAMGKQVSALITDMSEPLGTHVGNALEVQESIQTLKGEGDWRLVELIVRLGSEALVLAGIESDLGAAEQRLRSVLRDGSAYERFQKMVTAQGGQLAELDRLGKAVSAPVVLAVEADESGVVGSVDALKIGRACGVLGAGRRQADDQIDPRVGFADLVKRGSAISEGQPIGYVFAANESEAELGARALREAVLIKDSCECELPLVYERIAGLA